MALKSIEKRHTAEATHAPYVHTHHGLRLGTQYQAACPCGWAGVTWFCLMNAEYDVRRHAERMDEPTASRVGEE